MNREKLMELIPGDMVEIKSGKTSRLGVVDRVTIKPGNDSKGYGNVYVDGFVFNHLGIRTWETVDGTMYEMITKLVT